MEKVYSIVTRRSHFMTYIYDNSVAIIVIAFIIMLVISFFIPFKKNIYTISTFLLPFFFHYIFHLFPYYFKFKRIGKICFKKNSIVINIKKEFVEYFFDEISNLDIDLNGVSTWDGIWIPKKEIIFNRIIFFKGNNVYTYEFLVYNKKDLHQIKKSIKMSTYLDPAPAR